MFVNAFVDHVNDLKIARQSTDAILFKSAIDIFTSTNWSELMESLRSEFLAPDYDDCLFEEIKCRTQTWNESIAMYVCMDHEKFIRSYYSFRSRWAQNSA